MALAVEALLNLLNLERLEVNLFRGHSPDDDWQRVFGGQVIGQALMAAYRTVEGRTCHSLHAYFLRAGDTRVPIIYEVDASRDGRSFTSRRVVAIQHGKQIFHMSASFQLPESGLEHQADMPTAPAPDSLTEESRRRLEVMDKLPEDMRKHFMRPRAIEMRPVEPQDLLHPAPAEPRQRVWFRATGPLPDDAIMQQCVLAYASDMTLLDTSTRPHGTGWLSGRLQMASLDHAMWFHHPFRADAWLLYVQDSPSASGARGFNRGSIYTRDGVLAASTAQEGLIRLRP